ncbi:MAG TPA: hypothetical protein VM662_16140 [Sphingomonas sp.]|nr:hypothetical protein [Sphingomonas sp.]
MSGLFSRLVARTLRIGPALSPRLPTGLESWSDPASPIEEGSEGMAASPARPECNAATVRAGAVRDDSPPHQPEPHDLVEAVRTDAGDRGLRAGAPARSLRGTTVSAEPVSARPAPEPQELPAATDGPAPRAPPSEEQLVAPTPSFRMEDAAVPVPHSSRGQSTGHMPALEPPSLRGDPPPVLADGRARKRRSSPVADRMTAIPDRLTGARSAQPALQTGQLAAPAVPLTHTLEAHSQAPDVHITIGLVEVRAPSPASPTAGKPSGTDKARPIRLADYLTQRDGGRR